MARAGAPPTQTVFDPAVALPEAGVLRAATAAGDWATVSGFFDRFTSEDDRSFGARIVAEVPSAGTMLRQVAERDAGASLPQALLAAHYIALAWAARTSARATQVSGSQFAVMHDQLRQAERLLIGITAREPANALAWSLRLTTALGLELGQSEARRRYDRLAAHHPYHLAGQRRFVQQLCPKWGGSWEAAHAFAHACRNVAPPGGSAGILVADVHLERWLELGRDRAAEQYLRRPEVHGEITEAAQTSVLHPAYRSRFGWISGHSAFAMLFSLIGDQPRAAVHFRALGDFASEIPWHYLDDPGAAFQHRRAIALAKG
jgi:hypothetical protein